MVMRGMTLPFPKGQPVLLGRFFFEEFLGRMFVCGDLCVFFGVCVCVRVEGVCVLPLV